MYGFFGMYSVYKTSVTRLGLGLSLIRVKGVGLGLANPNPSRVGLGLMRVSFFLMYGRP